MADVFTKSKRSDIMSRIRSRGNKLTEVALIHIFRRQGISGWRRGVGIQIVEAGRRMLINPDFVFRKCKIVVFVDGEFWHGHPTRANIPKTNSEFWFNKIERNKARDRLQSRLLKKHGWSVIRIWQRDINSLAWLNKLRVKLSNN